MNSLELSKIIADQAHQTKALDLKILDLRKLSTFTDFFVICSGTSGRQMSAIAERVVVELKKQNIRPLSVEDSNSSQWILADYGDVVLHVFNPESRSHYDLEGYWGKASRVRLASHKKTTRTPKTKTKSETQTRKRRKS